MAAAWAGVGDGEGGGEEGLIPTQRCRAKVTMRKNLIKISQIN